MKSREHAHEWVPWADIWLGPGPHGEKVFSNGQGCRICRVPQVVQEHRFIDAQALGEAMRWFDPDRSIWRPSWYRPDPADAERIADEYDRIMAGKA